MRANIAKNSNESPISYRFRVDEWSSTYSANLVVNSFSLFVSNSFVLLTCAQRPDADIYHGNSERNFRFNILFYFFICCDYLCDFSLCWQFNNSNHWLMSHRFLLFCCCFFSVNAITRCCVSCISFFLLVFVIAFWHFSCRDQR